LALNEAAAIHETKKALELLAGEGYDEVVSKRISLLDILERHGDIQLPFAVFLQCLPPLRVRQ
jgi:cytochrome P450 / NADPH-cytochrome P450 reductase